MRVERWLFTVPLKLRDLFRRRRVEAELDDEIRYHLDRKIEDHVARGMTPEEARLEALRTFGGVLQGKEDCRDARGAWGLVWLERLWQDARYGCRMLVNNPGFTAVAVLSLAIGIGANTASFSFADALLLRPLPVPHASEVLTVGSTSTATVRSVLRSSYLDYVDIRDRSKSFDGLVAFTNAIVGLAAEGDTSPRLRIGMLVSANFFPVLGVEPQLGRAFRPEEDQVPGRDAVLMLGHDFWAQQFGADPSIVGRTLRLNGIAFTVIGVAPPQFTGLDQYTRFQFYAPLMMWPRLIAEPAVRPLDARDFRSLNIRGRLRQGATISQAEAELAAIATGLERAYPDTNRNERIAVWTERQARIATAPPVATLLLMLTLLAGAVLSVACANVAGLLTSRAPTRAREIALRLAIGAGRPRIVRQLITESVLMALVGGVLGVVLGYAGVALSRQLQIETELPIAASFELNQRTLLVSLALALTSAILFGLAPAIQSTRSDLTAVMKATDAVVFGRRRPWGRAMLVGGQVAISVVLLVVATFVYRGFQQRLSGGPGHRTDHLLLLGLAPDPRRYTEPQAQRFVEQVAERARAVPGVKSAALSSFIPMDGIGPAVTMVPEGFQFPAGQESATVSVSIVDEHYFDTMGLSILEGRRFLPTDSADAPRVAIVNEQVARHFWAGKNPLGKRFRLTDNRGPWVEIVGLAKTHKYTSLLERPIDFIYLPFTQPRPPRHRAGMVLLAESPGDPSTLITPLREVVRRLDAGEVVSNVRTMEELYRMRVTSVFNMVVGGVATMGMMGLGLSIVALYGLVAYGASRRTKEIGIRMAIGAGRADVVRMVLRQGLGLAIAGLGVGLLASLGAARALAAAFPGGPGGDGRTDVMAFPIVAVVVLAVTLLAAYIPARRASRISPTDALRYD